MGQDQRAGLLKRALNRLSTDADELDAQHLQREAAEVGATPLSDCGDRERVRVSGVIDSVRLRPRGGVPALEAELYDGSGNVMLVWLGRRRIAGISPGRSIVANGRITTTEGRKAIFNPEYELRPSSRAH